MTGSSRVAARIVTLAWLSVIPVACSGVPHAGLTAGASADPRRAVDELLATDRSFAAAAAATDMVSALSAMFADDVVMGAGATFSHGRDGAVAALRVNPENPTSKIAWSPVRGGISSDGQHGFTQGYVTTTRASGAKIVGKYLGYWVRGANGWRVAVYKRAPRPEGDVPLAMVEPSLPVRGLSAGDDAARKRFDAELRAAETAFSNEAAIIGIGPAFRKWGAPDAMNIGAGAAWAQGVDAISAAVAGITPRVPIAWSSSEILVAATGDLGVSIGFIKPIDQRADASPGSPFFTIWKRATPRDPWRYVAE